jgi:hypothetical protein
LRFWLVHEFLQSRLILIHRRMSIAEPTASNLSPQPNERSPRAFLRLHAALLGGSRRHFPTGTRRRQASVGRDVGLRVAGVGVFNGAPLAACARPLGLRSTFGFESATSGFTASPKPRCARKCTWRRCCWF